MSTHVAYRAYLLRTWRTADGEWRASLDDPHTGERLAFTALAHCLEYLIRVTRPDSAAVDPANRASTEATDLP